MPSGPGNTNMLASNDRFRNRLPNGCRTAVRLLIGDVREQAAPEVPSLQAASEDVVGPHAGMRLLR